jgi:cardiolipin synthase
MSTLYQSVIAGWIFFLLDLSLRLFFSARIVRRRLPASVAWAWISFILFIPIFGTVIYLYFGEYRQSKRRQRRLGLSFEIIARISREQSLIIKDHPVIDGVFESLAKAFTSLMGLPARGGNDIELLKNAEKGFNQLLIDVHAAVRTIDLEFFIWSDGGRADLFGEALVQAVKRGVTVRLLVDAIGSAGFIRGKMYKRLRENGVQVVRALPSGFWRSLFARPDLRIHRKIVVIDHKIGYTGSMNLADPKFFKADAGVGEWVDALARMHGPAVNALYGVFLSDWCAETGTDFAQASTEGELNSAKVVPGVTIQCLPSGPATQFSSIEQALIMSISAAQKEIILTTPYFVPSEALLYALLGAARRGVKTTLIVPAKVDSRLTQYASRSFLADLHEAGVHVALYRPGLLHTKSVTIDRQFSLFGSLNLDPRSLRINFEITMAVYDTKFAQDLYELQESYLKDSSAFSIQDFEQMSALEVWKGDLARLVGPLL